MKPLFSLFAFAALAVIGMAVPLALPVFAAAPDYSFGAQTLGWADPLWVNLSNIAYWTLIGGGTVLGLMWLLSRPKLRDWLTASEYNEAIALRGRYVRTGGKLVDGKAAMSVGEAIYIYGVIFLDKLVALWLATLIVYAAVG